MTTPEKNEEFMASFGSEGKLIARAHGDEDARSLANASHALCYYADLDQEQLIKGDMQ